MANLVQLKMLEDLDGFLLVDKPENINFSAVVKSVKRKFNLVKVGHGGSLDAMASGLMVLMINDANKFTDRVMGADREYEFSLDFTRATDTGDRNGRAVEPSVRMTPEALLKEFKGDVFQCEPRFAAIRKDGSADYEIVDTGEHSQTLSHVYRMEKMEGIGGGEQGSDFRLVATKGFLPRAMAFDAGVTLTRLRRTRQWKFDVAQAVPFAKLLEAEIGEFASFVTSIGEALR